MSYFNVRVYGLLINDEHQILISDEQSGDRTFSKFPGGGVELGEGLTDALKREFMEECSTEIQVLEHIYTTDFYEQSSFNDSQILSIYYLVKELHPLQLNFKTKIFDFEDNSLQSFRWIHLDNLTADDVTFLTDKTAINLLLSKPSLLSRG
ncbi:MAG: NUDIX domain-containing protein [Pedobacter sp.]|nr:MAG: NUDIX domain-containing protein [Pedobacter sp.]